MKKRIVALILTVVMSLLALTSCGGFDFVEEDLSAYASFDYAAFKAALAALEIEDGEFTTSEEIREKIISSTIYNVIADKIIADTDEEEWLKEGTLTAGAVLYFVYYAVDADGNTFFGSDMNESSITASSTKGNHTLKLDTYLDGKDNEFLKLVRDNLAEGDIKDFLYTMLTATQLQADAEKALKAEKPDATADEIKAAKEAAIKVALGDKLYISYTKTHKEKDAEGVESTVTEKASYEFVTITDTDPFLKHFVAEHSVANVGGTLEVFDKEEGLTVKTKKSFDVVDGEITYTYSDVKILWKVENEGKAMATFTYTPYVDKAEEPAKKEVAPSSLYTSASKVDLMNKELTYYVFPVYAIDTPAYEKITTEQILYYVYGSKLTEKSFDIFKDASFKNGTDTVADLLKDVADIYATTAKDNEFYKEGTDLKKLLDAYNKAVADGGDKPNDTQKTVINDAKEALTDAQNELLKGVLAKLVAATSGEKNLGKEIFDEYVHNTRHSLKETYDSDITDKVQKAVWKLIDESVTIKGYPEELLKEYCEHIYETYEYEYYKGDFDKNTSNYEKYDNLQKYMEAQLKVVGEDKVNKAIEDQAKGYLDPIIKIYVVAKACEADANAAMTGANGYIELDIAGGAYNVDEESYKDTYGDKAADKIAEAKKNAEESIKAAREEAGMFLVDDAYMNRYKKEIGTAYYNDLIAEYGEINLRAAFQLNRLFYYLTSTNLEFNEHEGHAEIKYTEDGNYISFRTVKYTIKADNE